MKPWADYHEDLIQWLRNPERAAGYLNAALEAGDREAFLMALRNVVEAQGGMTKMAKVTKINRVSLYKMLNAQGNPSFANILKLLQVAGIRFQVAAQKNSSHRKAA